MKLALFLLNIVLRDFSFKNVKDLNDRQKMVLFKTINKTENSQEMFRRQIERHIKTLALKTQKSEDAWFYRGVIFAYQNLMQTCALYDKAWTKLSDEQRNTLE